VLNLINNSLINCAGTNSSNFTTILNFNAQNHIHLKTRKKTDFFSQLPETRVLKFCPESEALLTSHQLAYLFCGQNPHAWFIESCS